MQIKTKLYSFEALKKVFEIVHNKSNKAWTAGSNSQQLISIHFDLGVKIGSKANTMQKPDRLHAHNQSIAATPEYYISFTYKIN